MQFRLLIIVHEKLEKPFLVHNNVCVCAIQLGVMSTANICTGIAGYFQGVYILRILKLL